MASSISSLNSLLLNPYTQTALQAAQFKGGIDPLKPGAQVTARYTVGDDGELTLREFNVESVKVLGPAGEGRKFNQGQDANTDEAPKRDYSFADFSSPKAQLAPSDEVALFAANLQTETPQLTATTSNRNTNVIEAEFEEVGKAPVSNEPKTVAAQQQQNVANLYAPNLDIIYNIIPLYSAAA